MVFHGDYEIEYEIYQKRSDDWRLELLGHIPGVSRQEAIERWGEQHGLSTDELKKIEAIVPGEHA